MDEHSPSTSKITIEYDDVCGCDRRRREPAPVAVPARAAAPSFSLDLRPGEVMFAFIVGFTGLFLTCPVYDGFLGTSVGRIVRNAFTFAEPIWWAHDVLCFHDPILLAAVATGVIAGGGRLTGVVNTRQAKTLAAVLGCMFLLRAALSN